MPVPDAAAAPPPASPPPPPPPSEPEPIRQPRRVAPSAAPQKPESEEAPIRQPRRTAPSAAAARYGRVPVGRFQIGIRLDKERHDQLRQIAFDRRMTMQTIFDELLDAFLAEVRGGQG